MSFLSGTQAEVIYNMPAAGASLNTSLAAAIITGNTSTNPPFPFPVLRPPSYVPGTLVKVVARGIYACTVSTPTLKVILGLNTTQGTAPVATTLAGTGLVPMTAVAVAAGSWILECDLNIVQVGTTGNTYGLYATGSFAYGASNNAATAQNFGVQIGGAQSGGTPSTPTLATFAPATTNWLEISAIWSASSVSNLIQCTQFTVYGMN